MVVFFGSLITFGIILKIGLLITNIEPTEAYKHEKFKQIMNVIIKVFSRMMLFACGIFWINKKSIKIDPKKYPKLKIINKKSKIICANHTSFVDIIILGYLTDISFIGKKAAADYPIVGDIAKTFDCLFIERSSSSDRYKNILALQERAKNIKDGVKYNNLIIFAEGTTSNGKGIAEFKKGAFILDSPLQPNGFKYDGKFHPGFTLLETIPLLIAIMANFYTSATYFTTE